MSIKLAFRSHLQVFVSEEGEVRRVNAWAQLDWDGAPGSLPRELTSLRIPGYGAFSKSITYKFEKSDFLSIDGAETWLRRIKTTISEALDVDNGKFGVLIEEQLT